MIEDIKAGMINCVIVKDLSRLGRNYIETGKLLERFFPFMGVRFIAINDSYDSVNHNAQTDNLILPFKNLINDAYCADISKKVRSQFDVRRKNGDFIGAFPVFGYTKDPEKKNRLIIDENAATVVRDIYAWKIAGMSQQSIADKLNAMGILAPLEYKKSTGSRYKTIFNANARAKWTHVAVSRILKNEVYIGALTQGISTTPNYKIKTRIQKPETEWVRVEQAHDPIVSTEDFALVANLMKLDTRVTPGGDGVYIFSGLLNCADCGRSIVRKPVKNSKYAYFVCSTYKKGKGCNSHSVSEKLIYDTVFETLTNHIGRCVEVERLMNVIEELPFRTADAMKLQKLMEQKQGEIDKYNARKVRLYDDYADGVMHRDEYDRFKVLFEKQIKDANNALESLQNEHERIASGGINQIWIEHFKKHRNMQCLTRAAVAELIDCITVFEGKRLLIRMRYQDEFEAAIAYLKSMSYEVKEAV
jgi:DNA invertase Pin-like site-specific DNA recombinase